MVIYNQTLNNLGVMWNEVNKLIVSNKYYIRTINHNEQKEIHYIKSVNDCVEIIANIDNNLVRFVTTEDLTRLLFEMNEQKRQYQEKIP